MQKTKLDISIGLLGAAIYFLGAINILLAFILAVYVLLFESDEWLKKSAVKMASVVIVFGLFSVGVGMMQDVFSVLNLTFGALIKYNIKAPLNLDSILYNVISFCKNGLLVIMGTKALTLGNVQVKLFDKMIDKNM